MTREAIPPTPPAAPPQASVLRNWNPPRKPKVEGRKQESILIICDSQYQEEGNT